MATDSFETIFANPSNVEFDYGQYSQSANAAKKTVSEVLDIFEVETTQGERTIIKKIGEKERPDVHKSGDLHLTGHVWIFNDRGEVLLQEVSRSKPSNPGLLTASVCGHITTGDTVLSGTVREVREEIGLNIQESELIPLGYIGKSASKNNEIRGVFALRYNGSVENLTLQEEEVARVVRIPIDELEADWRDPMQSARYARKSEAYQQMVVRGIRKILEQQEV